MDPPKPDPIDDPLSTPYGSLNDLAPDLATLHDQASRGLWRTLLDTISRARSTSLLTSPHHHLTYLTFNVLALTKLRRFPDALTELQTLVDDSLDSPEYRYESYPQSYPNLTGSMVPFALRWLHCLLPIKCGNRTQGLDRFYALLGFVRAKIDEKSVKEESLNEVRVSCDVWKRREVFVVNGIVTDHLAHKEFRVCLDLIRDLMTGREGFGFGIDPVLLSKLGYIQMQIGDLEGAKGAFDRVERIVSDRDGGGGGDLKLLSEVELKNLVNRNKALVYLVGKDYVSAVREYEECIERDGTDVVAINNKALCLMYLRDLSDSIKVLENSLERVPTAALNETLVVNLCSMYELAYVNHSDIKKTLSNWIARVAPDDFDSSCTRV